MDAPRPSASRKSRGKRAAVENPQIDVDMTDDTCLPPWPRARVPFDISSQIQSPPLTVSKSSAYINRAFNEEWDVYDSMAYNGLLNMTFKPSRILDIQFLRKLELDEELLQMMDTLGMGHIALRYYPLYPDYVLQCLASCRVEYSVPFERKLRHGTFSFKINGRKYRIPFRDICKIYGFNTSNEEVKLSEDLDNAKSFWTKIARGHWTAGRSSHTDIAHPVLRLLVKTLGHTVFCNMEVNKVRMSQLILLWHAIGDRFSAYRDAWTPLRVNMAAIFAEHLCGLRERGYTTGGKMEEFVGSLLTPMFRFVRLDLTRTHEDCSKRGAFMDEQHLKSILFLRSATNIENQFLYILHTREGKRYIPLPTVFAATATQEDLCFEVPEHEMDRYDMGELQRRQPGDHIGEASRGARQSHRLGAFEMPPEDIYTDQPRLGRFIVATLGKLWGAVDKMQESCRCARPEEVIPPRPQPPRPMEHDTEAGGSGTSRRRRRAPSQSQSSSDSA